jgi:CheY-like chemotaxis protein
MKILVVDDKQSVITQLSELLLAEGHEVTTAINGLDGYEKFQQNVFDLLVIDHLMPLMDGVQLLKNINQKDNAQTPIIFMTTQGRQSQTTLIEQSLCDTVIDKPVDEQHFLSLIRQLNKQNTRLVSL